MLRLIEEFLKVRYLFKFQKLCLKQHANSLFIILTHLDPLFKATLDDYYHIANKLSHVINHVFLKVRLIL